VSRGPTARTIRARAIKVPRRVGPKRFIRVARLGTAVPSPVRVASVREVPPGSGKVVVVQGHAVALFNVDGRFFAVSNTCLH